MVIVHPSIPGPSLPASWLNRRVSLSHTGVSSDGTELRMSPLPFASLRRTAWRLVSTAVKSGAGCPGLISGPTTVRGVPLKVTTPLRSSAMEVPSWSLGVRRDCRDSRRVYIVRYTAAGGRAVMLGQLRIGALVVSLAPPAGAQSSVVILSTTTSTQDSGLLDVLVPIFERRTGYTVKTISVGTGQALALAARGEADVTLCHAPSLETQYLADGRMTNRRLVMYNDFVIVGPEADPARIAGERSVVAALRRIAGAGARFVSRGDKSGTHALELALWKQAGVVPAPPRYIESGQGIGAAPGLADDPPPSTVAGRAAPPGLADDRRAYTLTDRATRLAFGKRVALRIVVEGDRVLRNIYSVMEVNPANGPRVNTAGGKAFADFMVSPEVQRIIRTFGVDRYGQPLFVPIAGKREGDVTS